MTLLSESAYGQEWLSNFDLTDRKVASLLIDRLMLVGSGEFTSAIVKELKNISQEAIKDNEKIALFAEREMQKIDYEVSAFFPGSERGRAAGAGIQPVEVNPEKQDVGSEGIVAALITKFCKEHPEIAVSHPGPDSLRNNKVRKIILVTDFIGSGQRIYEMLDAFAKVATIQSWISYHLISFQVVCYSGLEYGINTLLSHPLRPKVSCYIACPQIEEAFEGPELGSIKLLCKKYPRKSKYPFGFDEGGALIAFAHGIPNNAPHILHSTVNGWKPLFKGRSTFAADIDTVASSSDVIVQNSEKTLKIRNVRKLLKNREDQRWLYTMLVLKAINQGRKTTAKLSAHTQIPISEVDVILNLAIEAKWITQKNSLTALGRSELKYSRWYITSKNNLASSGNTLYFPTQLRAPC